jgi:hypothetical protein
MQSRRNLERYQADTTVSVCCNSIENKTNLTQLTHISYLSKHILHDRTKQCTTSTGPSVGMGILGNKTSAIMQSNITILHLLIVLMMHEVKYRTITRMQSNTARLCILVFMFIHVLTCKLFDAELGSAYSSNKLRKLMDKSSLSTYMWIAMVNGVRHYTLIPLTHDPAIMPLEPPSPFGTTFHTPINRLKVAFRTQSQIWWDNFLKGRLSRDWIMCMDHNFK